MSKVGRLLFCLIVILLSESVNGYDFEVFVNSMSDSLGKFHEFKIEPIVNMPGSEINCVTLKDELVNLVSDAPVKLQVGLSIRNYLKFGDENRDEIVFTNSTGQFRVFFSKPTANNPCPVPILKSTEGEGIKIKAGTYDIECKPMRSSGYEIIINPR